MVLTICCILILIVLIYVGIELFMIRHILTLLFVQIEKLNAHYEDKA
jgi:hypothetical protein